MQISYNSLSSSLRLKRFTFVSNISIELNEDTNYSFNFIYSHTRTHNSTM